MIVMRLVVCAFLLLFPCDNKFQRIGKHIEFNIC